VLLVESCVRWLESHCYDGGYVKRLPGCKPVLIALLLLVSAGKSPAASPDRKLLSLVPPGAPDVASISPPSGQPATNYFIVMTRNSGIDLNDFFALVGTDSKRSIHEVILVAVADKTGDLTEHGLLASGDFDRESVYKSALNNDATVVRYQGLSVLVVQPFARERGQFNEARWLAIPNPNVLLFGSIMTVRQELDRYLSHSVPDPDLLARLSRLRRDDEAWSVLSLPAWSPEIRDALAVIDPTLAETLKDGDKLQLGIHYGRQVEFEYEVTTASTADARTIASSLTPSFAGPVEGSMSLLPAGAIIDGNLVHGTIKVSMTRYNLWLAKISSRAREQNTASP
jgi:hypothetical protein